MKTPEQFMHELQRAGTVKQVVIYTNPNDAKAVLAQFKIKKPGPVVVGVSPVLNLGHGGQISSAPAMTTVSNTGGTTGDPAAGLVVIAVASEVETDQPV